MAFIIVCINSFAANSFIFSVQFPGKNSPKKRLRCQQQFDLRFEKFVWHNYEDLPIMLEFRQSLFDIIMKTYI